MMKRAASVLELMKETTLVRLRGCPGSRPSARLWALFEMGLPGGMKDRVALQMVTDAEERGELRPGGVIIESSSGTMAEGLARVGRLKGYRVVIVTDPRIDPITIAKLRALGADLEIVRDLPPAGGWQRARLERLAQLLATNADAHWTRQYDSESNGRAYSGVAKDLLETFGPKLACLVGAVGSGGSLCGLARVIRAGIPALRVCAVDAVGSVLFNQPDRVRLQSGHGNSIVPGNIEHRLVDEVHWLSDGEAFNACWELAKTEGIFGGSSSGAGYIVASWAAARLGADQDVVVIMPDRGDRYSESIYSTAFLEARGLTRIKADYEPTEIAYGIGVAERWSVAQVPRLDPQYYSRHVMSSSDIARELGLPSGEGGAP